MTHDHARDLLERLEGGDRRSIGLADEVGREEVASPSRQRPKPARSGLQPEGALEAYFEGHEASRRLFEAVRSAAAPLAGTTIRATRSQVAFRRRTGFAWVWRPDDYLHGRHAPLVLTLSLRRRDGSPRWKQIVEPSPGRFTHHLELWESEDVDAQVAAWLEEAWEAAG